LTIDRIDRGRDPRRRPAEQALLPARPCREVRAHQGEAGLSVEAGPEQTPAPEAPPPAEHRGGALRFLKELPVLIALALGIALLIKAFLVQAFYIPSASMEPTLRQGDRVLVNKLSYRFGHPKRGDVIVFRDPYPNPCDQQGS